MIWILGAGVIAVILAVAVGWLAALSFVLALLYAHGIAEPEEAFSGGDYQIHHRDECTLHNSPENLEKRENERHTPRHNSERCHP